MKLLALPIEYRESKKLPSEVVYIYQILEIENPYISILSDDFLKDVEGLQQKMLQLSC